MHFARKPANRMTRIRPESAKRAASSAILPFFPMQFTLPISFLMGQTPMELLIHGGIMWRSAVSQGNGRDQKRGRRRNYWVGDPAERSISQA
ncbi:MAG: hypothetical protein RIQ79_2239 [Verrucomicrobiota bacterium]